MCVCVHGERKREREWIGEFFDTLAALVTRPSTLVTRVILFKFIKL